MSALTDLFSSLADKIRSKTGGSDTYTPPEMVDAIDDVYDAGVAAGETTHTETYTPATNTAANDMGVTHDYRYVNTSGMITPSGNKSITSNGTNIDVTNYATASVAVPDPILTGDAAVGDVLSGKTFYKDSLTKQIGTMTNRGKVTPSGLNCGGSYTIPEGYHNGEGTVTANSLASQTGVDSGKTAVTAGAMLSGYQGWVNGNKVSGNVSSKAAETYNTSASDQTISSGQYLSGVQTIKAVTTSGISAANIKDGVAVKVGDANSATRIANVTGTFTDAATVSSGQTAAAAAQIKSGYSAWVDGAEVKGSYVEPTINNITPSNTSPVSMSANSNYKPSANGYAIQSYENITPTSNGTYFSSGMKKMSSSGYAYSSQPGAETTLWTNNSPTSAFAAQTVTLNDDITNYRYIKIEAKAIANNSNTGTCVAIYTPDDIIASAYTGTQAYGINVCGICMYTNPGSNNYRGVRLFKKGSTNQEITFKSEERMGTTSGASDLYLVPTKIIGIK